MRNEYYNVDGALNPYNYVIYFTHSGEPFKTQFIQNGGQVYNNTANGQYGGGIYISRSKETPFYEVICSLDFGKIYGNKAPNGYGGGVAVKTYPNSELIYGDYTPPADVAAQDVIVEVSYHDADPASTDEADKMFVYGNSANRGGGVYVEAFENTLPNNSTPNKVDVNIYGLAKVSNNNANTNGGGLYVETGTVRINSGTIGGSTTEVTATPIPSNGGNTAGKDGGGIYLNEGNIFTDVAAHVEPTGGGGGSGSGGGGGEEPPTPVLPEGFQEVEYITSTGGEVNTGIMANASHVTWAKVKRNGSGNMIAVYAVKNNNDGNNRFGCRIYSSTGHIVWRINGTGENEHKSVVNNVDEVFEVRQDYKSIVTIQNGVSRTYNYPTNAPASGTINGIGNNITFWELLANTGWGATNGNLYEAKIWNGTPTNENDINDPALLGWFIPCVKTDGNVVGVYDIKRDMFIAGTGNLTAGPTVRSEDRGQAMSHSGNSATMVPSYSTNRNNGGSRAAVAGCTISHNTANKDGGGAYVNTGNLFLMNAKVTDNTATEGKGGGVFTEHGNVYVNYWDANNPISGTNYSVRGETTPSEIKNNIAALNGGGVITRFGKVLMRGQTHNLADHIQISGNTTTSGSGGGIFCLGGASESTTEEYVRLINVKLEENNATNGIDTTKIKMGDGNTWVIISNGCGGGVYLQHGVINMTRCEVTSNTANVNGGGINNHAGSINIKGCTITGNKAGENFSPTDLTTLASGGGIFTVRGDVNLSNHPIGSSTYYTTQISGNTAYSNGGGITTRQGKVTAEGEYNADRNKNILITGNKATNGSGGGVFCLGKYGDTQHTYIDFTHVDIKNNTANGTDETTITVEVETNDPEHPIGQQQETITNGCGGGIYLQHGVIDIFNNNIQANTANQDGGGVYNHSGKIDVDGCLIGGESSEGNTAKEGNGGGIYTHEGDIDIEDLIFQPGNTLVRLESKVRYNTAKENGGGINTHKGTITINSKQLDDQIEISRNTANKGGGIYANEGTIIAYNAAIRNNTATENGGGINNHSGNIDLYGGMLSNNTAKKGNGGGAYTHVGDINIKPFNPGNQKPWLELSLNDGTRIYNNIANNNGGGLNNHTGLIDLHYASLQNNTSTLGNGGGIYCEGPHAATTGFTIRLLRSMVNQNKTRGQDGTEAAPTGRGGGIYLQYGRIFAQGSTLTFNKANINGGGINNHQGNIRAYGCQISNNVATTGRGGGIYANQGLIVVGPSGVAGASVIENNSAGINGGGINNHEGDIQINGDIIQNNTAGEKGGGIYLALGNITMNGGKIDYNSAGEKGGGVYIGGTKDGGQGFLIQERQPSVPVVEIIDVEDLGPDVVTIHYHIVDDGNGGNYDVGSHGVDVKYMMNGVETTLPTGITCTPSEVADGDVPGCRRKKITFTAGTGINLADYVFSARAHAEYTPSGTTDPLGGESSPVTFQLYSDKPVVVTGTVSGITASSASASGRLFYNGGYDVKENGIGIEYSLNANMSGATPVPYSSATTVFPAGGFYTMNINLPAPVNPYNQEEQPDLYNAFDPDYVQQTFYYRAYATNANGNTGYGEIAQFNTPKNTPDMGDQEVKYKFVTVNGVPSIKFSYEMPSMTGITNYGFVLSYDDDPALKEDYTIDASIDPNNPNKFTKTVPLSIFYEGEHYPSFYYYVRAFATGSQDEAGTTPEMDVTNYSITAATKFVIPDPDGKPQIRLTRISYITQESSQITGKIFNIGGSDITRYGVCWTDDTGHLTPTVEHADDVEDTHCHLVDGEMEDLQILLQNDSVFTITMSPLTLNTTYYLRAYAKNSTGDNPEYAYSNEYNFTTLPANPPVVRLQVNNIQNNQATIQCTIDDGGDPVSEYGIYWKEATATAFTQIQHTVSGTDTAPSSFEETLSGLQSDKEYKVYAYARNEVGEYTGREVTFHTPYNMPELSAVTVTAITYDADNNTSTESTIDHDLDHTITVKGQITSAGDNTVTAYGFLYSNNTDQAPTLNNQSSEWDWGYEEQASPTVSTEYTKVLSTNVNANKRYLIRAYAKTTNSSGSEDIKYGDDYASVLTLPQVNRGVDPTNITDNGATLHGIINTADPQGRLKRYGFCWVAASDQNNPTQPETLTVESAMAAADGGSVEGAIGSYSYPYHFDRNISGFTPGTKYYWRAWVTNEDYYNTDLDLAYRHANCIAYSTISAATLNAWNYYIATAVEPASAGSVSGGGGVDVINSTNTVPLTATANTGYAFSHWTKTYIDANENEVTVDAGTSTTLTITEGPSATYTAHFNPTVTWTVNGTGTVTATANNTSISSGTGVTTGATVTLTASTTNFVSWSVTGTDEVLETNNVYTFIMGTTPVNVTANFNNGRSQTHFVPRPRDIYPAPAREPWDWDDEWVETVCTPSLQTDTTVFAPADTLIPTRATAVAPVNIPSISKNKAKYGGGVYVEHNEDNPAKIVFDGGSNTAGTINYNYASEAGGGVYISRGAAMQMKGHCEVNANWVPAGKFGGGIYLDGRLYVGNSKDDGLNAHALKVNRNFAIDVTNISEITALYRAPTLSSAQKKQRNNVFLPRNDYDFTRAGGSAYDDESTVITLLSNISGEAISKTTSTNIGFSVNKGFSPVIATATTFGGDYVNYYSSGTNVNNEFTGTYEKWLTKLMPSSNGALTDNSAIFEDSETYIAIHTTTDKTPFRAKYIYLWGSWTNPAVDEDPETTAPMVGTGTHYKVTTDTDGKTNWEIYSEEGLSWFSSYVNGLNAFTPGNHTTEHPDDAHKDYEWNATKNPYAKAILMNDLDMTKYFWVPIGSVSSFSGSPGSNLENAIYQDNDTHHYKGTFNGNGHIINGLDCHYLTGIKKLGLFGNLDGATVKNVFVDNSHFTTDKADVNYYVGGISGKMTGAAVVSNSEARAVLDVTVAQKTGSHVGGIVGQMEGTAEVHSSMAMPEIKGVVDYMGGLVGTVGSTNNLFNSFANPKFPNATTNPYYVINENKYIGGLVGENNGTVANCYTRLQGDEPTSNGTTSVFAWFAGTNKSGATIDYCYAPRVNGDNYANFKYVGTGTGTLSHQENYGLTQRVSGKYGFKHRDQQLTTNNSNTNVVNNEFLGGLLPTLNKWVETANTPATPNPGSKEGEPTSEPKYSTWTRTMASPINDDYPVLKFADFNAVGSEDSIYMHYKHNVDDLIEVYTKINPDNHPTPSIYLYDTIRNGANILPITKTNIGTTHPNVMLAINENVGILQSVPLKARVGVTIRNSRKGTTDQTRDPNWHLFSSAIRNVPMGLVYDYTGDVTYNNRIPNQPSLKHELWSDRAQFDPPKTQWYQSDNTNATTYNPNGVGYFPTNTPYGTWRGQSDPEGFFDLYCYDEYYYHWINFKRAGKDGYRDHWHMDRDAQDGKHYLIQYTNEETLPQGKGYLMALSSESMLMADGTLNTGNDIEATVTKSGIWENMPPNGHGSYNYSEIWRSLNLIGNPYQSYLDFKAFVANNNNKDLLYNDGGAYCYATRDDNTYEYIYYTTGESKNYVGACQFIHPHQGFFVKVNDNGKLNFTDNMRVADEESVFRGEDLNYPLVNLLCYEASGKRNYTTVEINRPRVGGGLKMKNLKTGKALIYARFDDNDFQTLFAPVGVNTVPVRFETEEDGTFTLRWSKYHGDFSYLHLIDNLTGADIDCLTTDEYRFEAKTTDYVSRFKLVFNCTGIDEPEVPEPVEGPTVFAFLMGDELIVNGEGTLQLFDMNGRCLMTTQAVGQQSSVSLPKVSAGIYLLRLTGDKQVKVQKMVIK